MRRDDRIRTCANVLIPNEAADLTGPHPVMAVKVTNLVTNRATTTQIM